MYKRINSFKILLGGLLFFILAIPVFAEKSYHFDSFIVDITVNENSSILVEEYETFNFEGDFSFVIRDIPYQGEMTIDNIQVFDQADGHELVGDEISIYDTGYSKQITINFSAVDEIKTWLFKYKVRNAINFFDEHDELYWNVAPDDRTVNIDYIEANVYLPQALDNKSSWQQTVYSGLYGDVQSYDYNYLIGEANDSISFWTEDLYSYYNFTIVAGWPKNVVAQPAKFHVESDPEVEYIKVDGENTYFRTPYDFWIGEDEYFSPGQHEVVLEKWGYKTYKQTVSVVDNEPGQIIVKLEMTIWYMALLAGLAFLLLLYIISPAFLGGWLAYKWYQTGRDPLETKTIIPQYESYNNDPPGIVGTLIDEKAHLRDITSSIIDLAVRGYIKIVEKKEKKYTLKRLKDFVDDDKLLDYEKAILHGIFGKRTIKEHVTLESIKNKFYNKIPDIRDKMYKQLLAKKYFQRNPHKIRKKYYGWAIAAMIFGLVGLFIFFIGIPLIINSILLFVFAGRMPQKTVEGAKAWQWAEGYKMFLYHAERYRIANLTPEYFESCLPYAMVFEVEKQWAKNFEDIYKTPPDWYQGSDGYLDVWSASYFAQHLSSSFAPTLQTTLTSHPSSSGGYGGGSSWGGAAGGSSGFSGGGFSGGGFGGGGVSAG